MSEPHPQATSALKPARPGLSNLGQWINLLLPGGGMIVLGDVAGGLTIGVLFAASASLAVTGSLIVPDDFSAGARNLAIIAAALAYIVAQALFAQTVRSAARREASELRRRQLHEMAACLAAGDTDAAWIALQPLADLLDHDLLIALRWAQVLERRGSIPEAAGAWRRVKRLDSHHIYRAELAAAQRRRETLAAPPSRAGAAIAQPD